MNCRKCVGNAELDLTEEFWQRDSSGDMYRIQVFACPSGHVFTLRYQAGRWQLQEPA